MTMAANGYAKLVEELGELQQMIGKRLAYWTVDDHPDGGSINARIEQELGDVLAAIRFVIEVADNGLDETTIEDRAMQKLERFRVWHAEPLNNKDGIG